MGKVINEVQDGLVVKMVYSLCLDDGEVLDACEEHEAIEFIQGSGAMVEGFTNAIYGMKVGEERNFVVTPELGYGEYDPEANMLVPADAFPEDVVPELGMHLHIETDDGEVQEAIVEEISDEGVLLDLNHIFAGEELHFHVQVLEIREPTAEELAHGHVHSGHEH